MCPCCNGDGYISADIPKFASFVLTEASLHSTMKNLGIDDHAIHIAFLVAQRFGQDGLKEIQSIMMNVIKNFEWIENPSAFVSKACINFRKIASRLRLREKSRGDRTSYACRLVPRSLVWTHVGLFYQHACVRVHRQSLYAAGERCGVHVIDCRMLHV